MATILIVDDARSTLRALEVILKREGYTVLTAASGTEGLTAIEQHEVDLLLCDVKMPKVDGLTVLRTIRSDPALAATPVLMLSALSEVHHLERGVDAGANGYLTKPFDFRSLLEHVHRLASASHEVASHETAER